MTLAHHELFQDFSILLSSSKHHNFKISYTNDNLKLVYLHFISAVELSELPYVFTDLRLGRVDRNVQCRN